MKNYVLGFLFIMVACQKQGEPRQEITRLLEIQEMVYDDQSEENKQKFIATCADSLIAIGGDDGGMFTIPKPYVADFADGYTKKPYERKMQVYDNTVIVTSLHQSFKRFGSDTLFLNVRSTKIFVKERGEWKMAYATYAPRPVLYNKIAKVDTATLRRYTGVYGLADSRDSVYMKNGKLYSGGSELLPINDSTFIGDGYFGKSIFGKDNYTFEWNDGQRIRFDKIM